MWRYRELGTLGSVVLGSRWYSRIVYIGKIAQDELEGLKGGF